MRYLLVLALVLVVFLLARRIAARLRSDSTLGEPQAKSQTMVQCRVCKVHLPQEEALRHGANFYCCEDHLRQDDV